MRVIVDPEYPHIDDICGYFAQIAGRLDEQPERMRIVFDGRNASDRAIVLDIDNDGALRVSVGEEDSKRVDLRGRWIADHPMPISLTRAVLYVEPVDSNRFRVMSGIPFDIPAAVYVIGSLIATISLVYLMPEVLFATIGLCGGCLLVSHRP